MKTFRLDTYNWTTEPNRLTVRLCTWAYVMGFVIAMAVLIAPITIVRSVMVDPSITVGATRLSRGTQISWAKQTPRQRTEHLACLGCLLIPLTLAPLLYLVMSTRDQRHPLIFDKSSNQLRKGSIVLATLSAANSVAVVFVKVRQPPSQGPTQLFIRFNAEPWSIQFVSYIRSATAEQVATILAEFLAVPIVREPITVNHPSPRARGWR